MSDIIQLLPDSVANQIAAGEVIQRPASVVKELVENAIDAGATQIKVLIKDAGRTAIQVIDNGKGMSESDARLAFERHATSKIREAGDLFALNTMGFRGEALASIAAIAQVELRTREAGADIGTRIETAASRIGKQEPVACDQGANFLIKNLFYNVPARRKFLKSNATELRHILTEFQRIALAQPQVALSLYHNDQPLMNLATGNHRQRIAGILGRQVNQQLVPVNTEATVLNIHGFIGTPQGARKTAGDQYFFVNNRYMRHPYLHKAVMEAYANLIGSDQYPAYFLYFDVDPGDIDVNIHPTKTEIKFEDEKLVWKVLNAAVRESLGKHNIVPSIDFDTDNQLQIPVARGGDEIKTPQVHFNPDYNPFNTGSSYQRKDPLPRDWDQLYSGFESSDEAFPADEGPREPETIVLPSRGNAAPRQQELHPQQEDRPVQDATFFQLKNKYILTPVKSGLMVIDQRRAHERILYERFMARVQNRRSTTQQVLFTQTLSFGAEDAALVRDLQEELSAFGFDLVEEASRQFCLRGIPAEMEKTDHAQLIEELLEAYKTGEKNATDSLREGLAGIMARKARMHSGERLTPEAMTLLVGQLFQCSMPGFSPRGKTVFFIIDNEEFDKRFGN